MISLCKALLYSMSAYVSRRFINVFHFSQFFQSCLYWRDEQAGKSMDICI